MARIKAEPVRVKAERVAYLAVGIPVSDSEKWTGIAIDVLQTWGFAVKEMTPDDITAQADHIRETYDKAKEQTA